MIDIKELRIGNYVSWKYHRFMVTDIGTNAVNLNIGLLPTIMHGGIKMEDISGIRLSDNLLIECGLIRGTYNEFFIARFNLRPVEDKWEVYIQGNDTRFHWLMDLHFLHELQNLIYQFLRKELTLLNNQ